MDAHALLAELAAAEPLSGAALARRLGVTRAAVWKQIEALRHLGVPVQAQAGRGYRLPWPVQPLDAARIRAEAGPLVAPLDVHWSLDSTSSELQRRGDAPDLSTVLAETQRAGRGRRGRVWLSPPGLNIYLSCLKRFDGGFAALAGLSLAIGVAVVDALAELGIAGVGLKWPNDVYADGAKLAGVLVELNGEAQGPSAAIIGIGLNVRVTEALREQTGQPVADLAALCAGNPPDRNRVAGVLIRHLHLTLERFAVDGFAPFVERYRDLDLLCEKPLWLSSARGRTPAVGAGVDARGALLARTDGELLRVDSGDVSVRLS